MIEMASVNHGAKFRHCRLHARGCANSSAAHWQQPFSRALTVSSAPTKRIVRTASGAITMRNGTQMGNVGSNRLEETMNGLFPYFPCHWAHPVIGMLGVLTVAVATINPNWPSATGEVPTGYR